MTRFLSTLKTDVIVQVRNNLYAIGVGIAVLMALLLAWLAKPSQFFFVAPSLLLLVVGGSTMLYVAGMIHLERGQGTLNAVIVSPLRPSEYLWSKIITLTMLASMESIVTVGGAIALTRRFDLLGQTNLGLFAIGMVALGVLYTLLGIVLIVRYKSITDFLIPMSVVAGIFQMPFLYFLGLVKSPIFLVVPSTAPTMLLQGAYQALQPWEWAYALGYTALSIAVLSVMAHRAFHKHLIMKVG